MIFVLFSLNCYAVDNLTAQQKEAKEWLEKAKDVDCIELKIEYYTKAIELCPKHIFANYIRGWAYSDLGEYQKAIDDYSKAIEQLDPKTNSVHKLLGSFLYFKRAIAYIDLGEYQKAIDDYTKTIKLNPEDANAYYNRGLTYVFREFPTAACGDFYQAGILYLKQNNKTQALICVDRMKKVDSSSPLINKLMDKIY